MTSSLSPTGGVWRAPDVLPPELSALADGLRAVGVTPVATHPAPIVNVVAFPGDDETRRALAKRRHDVKAALRTLGFTVKALETGYKFDDAAAKAKVDAIAKAVQVLEREGQLLTQVLEGPPA